MAVALRASGSGALGGLQPPGLPLCSLASCPEPSQALELPTIMDNYQ